MLFESFSDNSKTAIDIGCGNGLFTKNITDKFESILSIDINPIRVKNLTKYFVDKDVKNVTVLEMSAYSIDKSEYSFDRALFYRSVDHIQDYYLALKEAYRVLKVKGKIYINILDTRYSTIKTRNFDEFRDFADELYDVLKIGEGMCEIKMVDIEKLHIQLSEIGFKNVETQISETGNIQNYFERINNDIIELLEKIKNASIKEYDSYIIKYNERIEKIKNEGIEFRPTLEIVGTK
jgi:ubiquinone/menaquinone biosynthesis C-methylase UbiE